MPLFLVTSTTLHATGENDDDDDDTDVTGYRFRGESADKIFKTEKKSLFSLLFFFFFFLPSFYPPSFFPPIYSFTAPLTPLTDVYMVWFHISVVAYS